MSTCKGLKSELYQTLIWLQITKKEKKDNDENKRNNTARTKCLFSTVCIGVFPP